MRSMRSRQFATLPLPDRRAWRGTGEIFCVHCARATAGAVERSRLTRQRSGEGLRQRSPRNYFLCWASSTFSYVRRKRHYQSKHQSVCVGSAKHVNAGASAVFRDQVVRRFLELCGIAGDRIFAPDIAFAVIISVNIERASTHRQIPSEVGHVPTSADGPDFGAVAQAFTNTSKTPAKIIWREIYFHAVHSASRDRWRSSSKSHRRDWLQRAL